MRAHLPFAALLAISTVTAAAGEIAAANWTVKADARSTGRGVKIHGSVAGPPCKQLRLTVFTNGASGWTGVGTTTVKDVSGSRKFFDAYSAFGGGRDISITGATATCIGR